MSPRPPKAEEDSGLYTVFPVEMGWMGLAYTERGVFASTLPQSSAEQAASELLARCPFQPVYRPEAYTDLENTIKSYFKGVPQVINCEIDWSWASPFRQRVLEVVRDIPPGKFLSYGEVADLAGSPGGARAVGGALAANMLPVIIPCHRVIRSNGSIGGFTGAPLDIKAQLLQLEGASLVF